LRYTIESRELTSEYTDRPAYEMQSRRMEVEASDPDEAIHRYVAQSEAELVSFSSPGVSSESIATVKKEDAVFLVRVYTA
jgi:hypothetical protein